MSEIKLTIDNLEILIPEDTTILEAARKAGSYIPALCDHPDLKPIGYCKLCIISVEGREYYPTACNNLAEEGMVIQTTTPELQEMRRNTLEMLLALTNHPTSCLFCERKNECTDLRECMRKFPVTAGCKYCLKNGECEFQQAVEFVGLDKIRYQTSFSNMPVLREPFFDRNYNLCIICGRCVRTCEEVRGEGIPVSNPDFHQMHWIRPESLQDADCKFCGSCVDACTTGRILCQYHTGTMTRKVGDLNFIRGEELVEVNPGDATALGIVDGELIDVTSRRGKVRAKAKTTEKSPAGVVFMTFHFAETPTNVLTNPALDPIAKIPD